MPENVPKAVMILIWLLSGTIIFGAILMKSTVTNSVLFLLVFFAIPVFVYQKLVNKKSQQD